MSDSEASRLQEGFRNVAAQAADPALFFRMLDMQASQPAIVAMRARAVDVLDPAGGARFLDAGCGTGEVARAIGERMSEGTVTGLDASPTMLAEAARRTPPGSRARFALGDATALGFADACFDGVHCERVLQHLADPAIAVRELVRVTRPGRRVVVADTDWETAITGPLDPDVDRRVRLNVTDGFANGRVGRRLLAMLTEAGLSGVSVEPFVLTFTSWDSDRFGDSPVMLALARCEAAGVITAAEARSGRAALMAAHENGTFFAAVSMFLAFGTKP